MYRNLVILAFSLLLTSCGGGGGGGSGGGVLEPPSSNPSGGDGNSRNPSPNPGDGGGGSPTLTSAPTPTPQQPTPISIDFQDPGDNDGWWGQYEFAERLRTNPNTGTQVTIVISDAFRNIPKFPGICKIAGDQCHGDTVSQIVRRYGFGTVEDHHDFDEDAKDRKHKSIITRYSSLTTVHIHNLSRLVCFDLSSDCFTRDLVMEKGAAIVIPTGNNPNILNPRRSRDVGVDLVLETGLLIYVSGLAKDRMGKHIIATPCGFAMHSCILAPWDVEFIHPVSGVTTTLTGTSYSTPQVASALSMLRTRWPQLDNRMAISLVLTTAMDLGPPGVDAETGWGALDFRSLFSPVGDLRLPSSTKSLRSGVLNLPGLNHAPNVDAYDSFKRDFPLVTGAGNILLSSSFQAHEWWGDQLVTSPLTHAIGRRVAATGVLYIQPTTREIGFAKNLRGYNGALSFAHANDFFGGYGTGSLAFGPSKYLSAQIHKTLALASASAKLQLGVRHSCGYAKDGVLVQDLHGCMSAVSSNLSWNIGTRLHPELAISYGSFSGDFKLAGEKYQLASEPYSVWFGFKMEF